MFTCLLTTTKPAGTLMKMEILAVLPDNYNEIEKDYIIMNP